MSTFPPRPPVSERAASAARKPVVAGIIGGLVVLVIGALLVATGVVGKEEKTTIVQSPVAGAGTPADEGRGLTVNEIYKRDGPGVVFIRAEVSQQADSPFGLPQEQRGTATGSGFVIDKDGHILTNAHVVEGASKVEVSFGEGQDRGRAAPRQRLEHRRGDAEGRPEEDRPQAAEPRRQLQARGGRRGGRDRQPVRPRPHGHDRDHQRPPAPARGAQRLQHPQRDPDGRGDQPRQLRWSAARQPRPCDRDQLADRDRRRRRRLGRDRVRGPRRTP